MKYVQFPYHLPVELCVIRRFIRIRRQYNGIDLSENEKENWSREGEEEEEV